MLDKITTFIAAVLIGIYINSIVIIYIKIHNIDRNVKSLNKELKIIKKMIKDIDNRVLVKLPIPKRIQ